MWDFARIYQIFCPVPFLQSPFGSHRYTLSCTLPIGTKLCQKRNLAPGFHLYVLVLWKSTLGKFREEPHNKLLERAHAKKFSVWKRTLNTDHNRVQCSKEILTNYFCITYTFYVQFLENVLAPWRFRGREIHPDLRAAEESERVASSRPVSSAGARKGVS